MNKTQLTQLTLDEKFFLATAGTALTLGLGWYLYTTDRLIRRQAKTINIQSQAIQIQRQAMEDMVTGLPIMLNMN